MDARTRIARNYDRRAPDFGSRDDDDFAILRRVLTGREVMLDVGCGAGGSLRRFIQHHGRPSQSFGLDVSPGMLRRAARDEDLARTVGRGRWILGDAENLPFASEMFDIVISVNALSHLSSLDRAMRIQHRVLRRGGRLAVKFRGDLTLDRPVEQAMRSALGRELAARRLRPILDMYRPSSADLARQSALDAGFENVEVSTFRRDWNADPEELIERFASIIGYMLDQLTDQERRRVLTDFRKIVREQSGPDGVADFDYSVTVTATRPR